MDRISEIEWWVMIDRIEALRKVIDSDHSQGYNNAITDVMHIIKQTRHGN